MRREVLRLFVKGRPTNHKILFPQQDSAAPYMSSIASGLLDQIQPPLTTATMKLSARDTVKKVWFSTRNSTRQVTKIIDSLSGISLIRETVVLEQQNANRTR